MKVFASRFLESPTTGSVAPVAEWKWTPENANVTSVYGSGANTQSRQSTYADERDNRDDADRPNEGLSVA